MFDTLLETRARRTQRSAGGTIMSVVVHSAVIVGAMVATARGSTPPPRISPPTLVFVKTVTHDPAPTTTSTASPMPSTTVPSHIVIAPLDIPVGIPDVPVGPPIDASNVFVGGTPPGVRTGGDPAGSPRAGEPWTESLVEKPAFALPGSPTPMYPEMLRRAGVEGEVVAQFVVDTAGRVEPGSFRATRETQPLFVAAVERVLPRMRFVAAEAGGRRVRQLVQQSFVFSIAR